MLYVVALTPQASSVQLASSPGTRTAGGGHGQECLLPVQAGVPVTFLLK